MKTMRVEHLQLALRLLAACLAVAAMAALPGPAAAVTDDIYGMPDLRTLKLADIIPRDKAMLAKLKARGAKGVLVLETQFTQDDLDDMPNVFLSYFNDALFLKYHTAEDGHIYILSDDGLALFRMLCADTDPKWKKQNTAMIARLPQFNQPLSRLMTTADRQCYQHYGVKMLPPWTKQDLEDMRSVEEEGTEH